LSLGVGRFASRTERHQSRHRRVPPIVARPEAGAPGGSVEDVERPGKVMTVVETGASRSGSDAPGRRASPVLDERVIRVTDQRNEIAVGGDYVVEWQLGPPPRSA
jgi:hypothetical protein